MGGKIFTQSSNLHQDQAKVLFDYYLQAAEKTVKQEVEIEEKIDKLIAEKEERDAERSKAAMWKWILAILIIPFIVNLMKENRLKKEIEDLDDRITEFRKIHSEIFRDYQVKKLGVAYVPVATQVKYENKSFIVDYTDTTHHSNFKLQISKQNDLLIDEIASLELQMQQAPLVETSKNTETIATEEYSLSMQELNQHDYFGALERTLRTISFCVDDLDETSVMLPLIENNSYFLGALKEFGTAELPQNAPIFSVFDTERFNEDIAKFQEINKLKDSLSKHSSQFEDVLKDLMVNMAGSVQTLSALKIASSNKMVMESNKLLYRILKAPYNHYSPVLESMEIERIKNESFNYNDSVQDYEPFQLKESSRVKYDLVSGNWLAEDGKVTNFPFGVHQIQEEIVAPIVQNLMVENRIERMKIYNHIKDQKINYLNQWHQDTEDFYGRNRSESSALINLMRGSLREYIATYNTLISFKKTAESMNNDGSLESTVVNTEENPAEALLAFEEQSKHFEKVQSEFEDYMERLQDDINLKADKFGYIEYYDAKLRDGHFKDVAVATDEVHGIDERRRALVAVNPLFAKTSDLPPSPSVEDITFEHMALNLPLIAKAALSELESASIVEDEIREDEIEQQKVIDEDIIEDIINEEAVDIEIEEEIDLTIVDEEETSTDDIVDEIEMGIDYQQAEEESDDKTIDEEDDEEAEESDESDDETEPSENK